VIRIAAALVMLAACSARDIVASSGESPYCSGTGPPIIVGDGITVGDGDGNPDEVCTGTVAVLTFKRALCTCEDYSTSTMLTTDSFDGRVAPYSPGTAGTAGAVGTNGGLSAAARVAVGGALAVAGAAGASFQVDATIARSLDVNGPLSNNVAVTVGADANIAGNISLASLSVAGTLTVPSTATLGGTITAGATVRAPVSVSPPCGCSANDIVDIAGFIANQRDSNNNDSIDLSASRLTDYTGDQSLSLPCGVFYAGPIRGMGALILRITGRVVLLVDGDVTLTSALTIELATEDAELDLMIAGVISSNSRITIGRPEHPSRTRIYVGGSSVIQLSGDSQIAANIYAPRTAIALSAPSTIFGSLFVRRIDQAAPIAIHYDEDVLRADVGCLQ
jgi:hypothetical protein